jgi:hypothetical protein
MHQRVLVGWFVVTIMSVTPAFGFPGFLGAPFIPPNDPKYQELWQFFSHLPGEHRIPAGAWEWTHGSGMHVDRAWQLHLGDPSTIIAVLDSGIRWQQPDLRERYYLNVGELPPPMDSHGFSRPYDLNGDGRVSVADYRDDARVFDANANGVIDPGDLIRIFSDQRDDDQNGYLDDISGWDFHEQDNDPEDRTNFGHGTGEALDSAAAVNNGIDGAGACGDCTVLMLRVNDSFVVDANAFSAAVHYATKSKVAVIQQALGALNVNESTQKAIDQAYDANIIIVGSAADENSYHHNQPSGLDPILYPNASRFDGADVASSSSFTRFNNCSNYGPRIDVTVAAKSCSSEATGKLAGIAALARSYANRLHVPIDVSQMIALIKHTATDFSFGGATNRHPTHTGWDEYSGYGRVHAFDLLDVIRQKRIPPSLRVNSPKWFAALKSNSEDLSVELTIAGAEAGVHQLSIFAMAGIQGDGESLIHHTKVDLSLEKTSIKLAIEANQLTKMLAAATDLPERYRRAITLRVVLSGPSTVAEQRRTIFMHDDQDLFGGFPLSIEHSVESGVLFYDLDGDERDELIAADGGGWLHAWRSSGEELAGFPLSLAPSRYHRDGVASGAAVFAPLAVGDIDGDGSSEIVALTMEAQVIAVDRHGRIVGGFPVQLAPPDYRAVSQKQILAQGALAAPVLFDLDHDGDLEIIAVDFAGSLHALNGDGSSLGGFPRQVGEDQLAKLVSSPLVGDFDKDGSVEIIFGSNHHGSASGRIFGFRYTHANVEPLVNMPGFPTRIPVIRDAILPTIGTGVPTTPILYRQGKELMVAVHPFVGKMYGFDFKGRLRTSFSIDVGTNQDGHDTHMFPAFGHPALFRTSADQIAIATVGSGKRALTNMLVGGQRFDYEHLVGAWDVDSGAMLPNFPRVNDDMQIGVSPVSIDFDGDGRDELVIGSGGYFLRVYSQNKSVGEGFPKFTGGWMIGSPAFGDFDGDGNLDIAAATREGKIFVWRSRFTATVRATWPTFKANLQRTGVYHALFE